MKVPSSVVHGAVIVSAMVFMFFWVKQGLGDAQSAAAAMGLGVTAVWFLFQKAGDQ